MKFERQLNAEAIPEWRTKYIAYKQLKRLIYAIKNVDLADDGVNREELCEEFFETLSNEIKCVNDFYYHRLSISIKQRDTLVNQLDEWYRLYGPMEEEQNRQEFKATGAVSSSSSSHDGNFTNTTPLLSAQDGASVLSASSFKRHNVAMTDILSRSSFLKQRNTSTKAKSKQASLQSKQRIKSAWVELFRSVFLLKDFRSLNLTGYRKIVKKFEKSTQAHSDSLL